MKPAINPSNRRKTSSAAKSKAIARKKIIRSTRRQSSETGIMVETGLKLFFSVLVAFVAGISLTKLLPYHFAQSGKLKELRAQVKETEYRVETKRQQLQKNFDSQQTEALMEQHSPRITKNRVRVFWQDENP